MGSSTSIIEKSLNTIRIRELLFSNVLEYEYSKIAARVVFEFRVQGLFQVFYY